MGTLEALSIFDILFIYFILFFKYILMISHNFLLHIYIKSESPKTACLLVLFVSNKLKWALVTASCFCLSLPLPQRRKKDNLCLAIDHKSKIKPQIILDFKIS